MIRRLVAALVATLPLLAGAQFAHPGNHSAATVKATGSTTARSLAARFADSVNVKDFAARGDGTTDDTAAFTAAIAAASGKTLRVPAGTYRLNSAVTFTGANVVGEGPDATILDCYATPATCATFDGGTGLRFEGMRIRSQAAGQSGLLVRAGTGARIERVRVLDFDGVGLQLGVAGATGVYFATVEDVELYSTARTGTTGVVVDGGAAPNSNANTLRNVFVRGKWSASHWDVRGNKNVIDGGDVEPNNSAAALTQVYLFSGVGNEVRSPYIEPTGATVPAAFFTFTSTAQSNRVRDAYVALGASSMPGGLGKYVADAGTNNEVSANPNGYNFVQGGRAVSYANLVPNAGFVAMRTAAIPLGWVLNSGVEASITRDTGTLRGQSYSLKFDVTATKASVAAYLATNNPAARFPLGQSPVARFRGKTLTVGAWVLTTTAGCGGVRLYTGASAVGAHPHSGSGAWEFLSASARVDDAATEVAVQLLSDKDNADKTCVVYFSEPVAVIGPELPQQSPRPLADTAAFLAGPLVLAPPTTGSPTNGGSVTPSAADGNLFVYTAGAGVASFTVNAPTGPQTGQTISFRVKNASGGALATTWNAVFKMSAWTAPANGQSRAITFQYDGTNWIEASRTPSDVPN